MIDSAQLTVLHFTQHLLVKQYDASPTPGAMFGHRLGIAQARCPACQPASDVVSLSITQTLSDMNEIGGRYPVLHPNFRSIIIAEGCSPLRRQTMQATRGPDAAAPLLRSNAPLSIWAPENGPRRNHMSTKTRKLAVVEPPTDEQPPTTAEPTNDAAAAEAVAKATTPATTTAKATRTEKRCAAHHTYFGNEPEVRPLSEFYGDARSSYCKRCQGKLHAARRQALAADRPHFEVLMRTVWQRLDERHLLDEVFEAEELERLRPTFTTSASASAS